MSRRAAMVIFHQKAFGIFANEIKPRNGRIMAESSMKLLLTMSSELRFFAISCFWTTLDQELENTLPMTSRNASIM
jgi:hypothetical protein